MNLIIIEMNKGVKLYNRNHLPKAKQCFEELLKERGYDLKILVYLIKIDFKMELFEECL